MSTVDMVSLTNVVYFFPLNVDQRATQMDILRERLNSANVKSLLIGKWNTAVTVVSVISMIILISSWGAETASGSYVKKRLAASVIGLLLQIGATALGAFVQRAAPNMILYYLLQGVCLVALFVATVAMGMNNVIVDLCQRNIQSSITLCSAHIAEFFGEFLAVLCMGLTFITTQQRVVVFIDKGILDGIKGRTNGMQQLP